MAKIAGQVLRQRLLGDPLGYLKNNIVVFPASDVSSSAWDMAVAGAIAPGGIAGDAPLLFTGEEMSDTHDVKYKVGPEGKGACVQVKVDAGGDAAAYFLPWAYDSQYYVDLRLRADLFFNANMDGCAFGWTVNQDGTVKVAHSNIEGSTGTDRAAMKEALKGYQYQFMPQDYRDLGGQNQGKCAIVGVLEKETRWSLYAQVYNKSFEGKDSLVFTYTIQEVRKLGPA